MKAKNRLAALLSVFAAFWLLASTLFMERANAFPEANVLEAWDRQFTQFGKQAERTFQARDGVTLSYLHFAHPKAKALVVIGPGRAEPARKYTEVAFDLHAAGYSVYVLDWRGQGASMRLQSESTAGYVESFQDYAGDLKDLVQEIEKQGDRLPKHLIAHSMGGTSAILFLVANPGVFKSAVLSAPMLGIDFGVLPEWLARALVTGFDWIGRGKSFALSVGPYKRPEFEKNNLTTSRVRFDAFHNLLEKHPALSVGGPSNHWLRAALDASEQAAKDAAKISIPLLLLKAGSEKVVRNDKTIDFQQRAKACREVLLPGAEHEILMERDPIRDQAMKAILAFFQETAI